MTLKSHILLVDDEHEIREPVSTYLSMHGFDVSAAANQGEAMRVMQTLKPDIAVIDVVLADGDGISLCKDLRHISNIPVIFVSGKSDETERIIGLEVGADDFIEKPFNPRELLARIKAVLRRTGLVQPPQKFDAFSQNRIKLGPWILDPSLLTIFHVDGRQIQLSNGETKLMLAFAQNPRTVMSRDRLLDHMGGKQQSDVFDRSIDNYIARLRKKIEETPRTPRLLKTYWGGGYALNCDAEVLP